MQWEARKVRQESCLHALDVEQASVADKGTSLFPAGQPSVVHVHQPHLFRLLLLCSNHKLMLCLEDLGLIRYHLIQNGG